MPVAPAEAERQAVVTHADNQLKDLHHSVANNLHRAGVPTTYEAVKPVHVPDEPPKTVIDKEKIETEHSVPGSYDSTPKTVLSPLSEVDETLNHLDQIVTGRRVVTGQADRFAAHQDEREAKKMEFANAPKEQKPGLVKKLVDWLHK